MMGRQTGQQRVERIGRRTVGVFDSGFGGLTVLRAILPLLPEANSIYLGDTARLPYGSKSRETISRYAVSSGRFLEEQGSDLLVVACNTATALALDDLRAALKIPVIGVIEPGAAAAEAGRQVASEGVIQAATVLVLATEATVQSGAYTESLQALGLGASEKACPLLVPLVEEGWTDHPVTDAVLRIYLSEALEVAPDTDTLLLGCTHYPLLEPAIRRTLSAMGRTLRVIDSAEATALATLRLVRELGWERAGVDGDVKDEVLTGGGEAVHRFFATDSVAKFERLGARFLGQPISLVEHINLGG